MLNYIWFGLMAIALVVAAFNGTAEAVTKAAIDSAKTAVEIAIGLVGVMTLWLGIMRIAEAAGLVTLLGRALRPVLRWLFPGGSDGSSRHRRDRDGARREHARPQQRRDAARHQGDGRAADAEQDKETATNPMVTFMAINTAGVQLIPATMIGVLAAAGSVIRRRSSPRRSSRRSSARSPRWSRRSCCSGSTRGLLVRWWR